MSFGSEDRLRPLNPSLTDDASRSEETYDPEPYDMQTWDWVLFVCRCVIIFVFLIFYTLVFVNVARGTRLKNWRLYCLAAVILFCWLGLSLYQDHIDEYFVQAINRYPQKRSIFWCFRNLLHGLTLFSIVLVLSHLADFQHRGIWLWLVGAVVVIPLLYCIALLIIDLRLHPDSRGSLGWSVAINTVRVFLFNFLTSLLLIIFCPRFCTSRLYGTYEEDRSCLVVLVSRWTYGFLMLHNAVAIASYSTVIAAKVDPKVDADALTNIHRSLDEVAFLMIVLAVPGSYIAGIIGQGCPCAGGGTSADVEMEKMDKIYQEVWTSNQGRRGRSRNNAPPPINTDPDPGAGANRRYRTPADGTSVTSTAPNGTSSTSRSAALAEKRRKRESYLEAVSTGSLDERSSVASNNTSVTSEPIDL